MVVSAPKQARQIDKKYGNHAAVCGVVWCSMMKCGVVWCDMMRFYVLYNVVLYCVVLY